MEYVVIGAGPAGLQLAYYLQRAGRDHVVLEAGPTAGTFFRTFPRHRRMISINKPHTGWRDPEKDMGAQAVAIGRPVLWGLAVAGEAGVARVLELLRVELVNALTLLGVESPAELARDQVEP